MVYTLVFTLALIVHFSECSLQSAGSPYGERDPDPPSSSAANISLPPECSSRIDENPDCEHNPVRARSRSPGITPPSIEILGYSLEQLGYIRLIPRTNERIQFEFRKYSFPVSTPIVLRVSQDRRVRVPTQEQIVSSLPNGDVFAILDHSGFLFGLYRSDRHRPRVKINMISGEIKNLTPDEINDCQVGKKHPIFPNNYIKCYANYDLLNPGRNINEERNPGSSSSGRLHSPDTTAPEESLLRARSMSPPGNPPFHEVLGHPLATLGYIRLIPRENPNRQFEFRRYIFPVTKAIRLYLKTNVYVPVPALEHIVLSTSNDEVFAILEYTGILRGLYGINKAHSRIKVNMKTVTFDYMTEIEKKECHIGYKLPISTRWFKDVVTNEDSLQNLYH